MKVREYLEWILQRCKLVHGALLKERAIMPNSAQSDKEAIQTRSTLVRHNLRFSVY